MREVGIIVAATFSNPSTIVRTATSLTGCLPHAALGTSAYICRWIDNNLNFNNSRCGESGGNTVGVGFGTRISINGANARKVHQRHYILHLYAKSHSQTHCQRFHPHSHLVGARVNSVDFAKVVVTTIVCACG